MYEDMYKSINGYLPAAMQTRPASPLVGLGGDGWLNDSKAMEAATQSAQNALNPSLLGQLRDALKTDVPGGWFGDKDNPGLLPTGIGMATDLANSWLAMQQLDLAKEQFGFQKEAFNKQYENQRTLTNSRLKDRQRARLSANPNAYQSVGDYMKQNGV